MVVCQGQLDSVVPLEPATMSGVSSFNGQGRLRRYGIVKVDLLASE